MNLEPAPRLNKTPFVLTAAGCLAVVVLIGLFAENKFAPLPFVSAVGLLLVSIVAIMLPILVEHRATEYDYVQRERARTEEQVQRLHAASESLGRAAAQIKAIEEAVHKSAHAAEHLPYRMQEKLAEFNQALAEKENDGREALEREVEELRAASSEQLKAVADKVAKATAEWSALEAATRKQFTAAQGAAADLDGKLRGSLAQFSEKIQGALTELDRRLAELDRAAAKIQAPAPAIVSAAPPPAPFVPSAAPVAAAPTPEGAPAVPAPDLLNPSDSGADAPAPAATPASASAENTVSVATEVVTASASTAVAAPAIEAESPVIKSVTLTTAAGTEELKPKKPRAPRKPKPDDILAAMSDTNVDLPAMKDDAAARETAITVPSFPLAESRRAETETTEIIPEAQVREEPAATSDGATRLLATAYIGIGNKLFIRGEGPGLSWDKGVPMQFVSIGKWGWASHDVTAPVRAKLYKNDDTLALSGEVVLSPGKHVEVTALF